MGDSRGIHHFTNDREVYMDVNELRARVEASRGVENEAGECAQFSVPMPRRQLDAEDIAQIKERAYMEGRGDGYREGADHARQLERERLVARVNDAETRGVLAGLLVASEAIEAAPMVEGAEGAMRAARDVIASTYEAVSREGLHGERQRKGTEPKFEWMRDELVRLSPHGAPLTVRKAAG